MRAKKRIKAFLSLALSNYAANFFSFVKGYVVIYLLGPVEYGYLVGLRLIPQYGDQIHLGALTGMGQRLPVLKGAGNKADFERVANAGTTFLYFNSLLWALLIIAYSFLFEDTLTEYTVWGLRIYAFVIVMVQMSGMLKMVLTMHYKFETVARGELLYNLLNCVLTVCFVYFWGIYGSLVATLLVSAILYLYFHSGAGFKWSFTIDLKSIWELIKIGIPISLFHLIDVLLSTVDRIMILRFINAENLGLFSVSLPIIGLALKVSGIISFMMYPRLLERIGACNENIKDFSDEYDLSLMIVSLFLLVSSGLLFLTLESLIVIFFPKYVSAVTAARILVASIYFQGIFHLSATVLVALRRNRKLLSCQLLVILVNIIINYLLIKNGFGINGVAAATCCSYFIYAVLLQNYVWHEFKHGTFRVAGKFFKLIAPFSYGFICLMFLRKYMPVEPGIVYTFLSVIFYLVLLIPAFIFILRSEEFSPAMEHLGFLERLPVKLLKIIGK